GRAGAAPPVPAALAAAAEAAALASAIAAAPAGEATAPATLGASDLRCGVTHGRAELVDLQLDDVALLALAGLEGTLDQTTLRDHPHALGEGLGDVLRSLAPDGATHEESLTVPPLTSLAVEQPRGGRDGEVGHGRTRGGEPQLRVSREVSDHGDDGVACHDAPNESRAQCASGRISLVRRTDSLRPSWRSSSLASSGVACLSTSA